MSTLKIYSYYPPMIGNINNKRYVIDCFFGWVEVDEQLTLKDIEWIDVSKQYKDPFNIVIDKIVIDEVINVVIRDNNKYSCSCGKTNESPCNHINTFMISSQEILNKRINRKNTISPKETIGENIKVKSFSNETTYHNINVYDGIYSCDCIGYYRHNLCAHIEFIKVEKGILNIEDTKYLKKYYTKKTKKQPIHEELDLSDYV